MLFQIAFRCDDDDQWLTTGPEILMYISVFKQRCEDLRYITNVILIQER